MYLSIIIYFSYPQSAFNKTLMSHAAISALRLHQRLPAFTLSREFLGRLFNEDSCHYLMYSLMFFNMHPTFFVLLPILLFAVIHVSSYSLKLLDVSNSYNPGKSFSMFSLVLIICSFFIVNRAKFLVWCPFYHIISGISNNENFTSYFHVWNIYNAFDYNYDHHVSVKVNFYLKLNNSTNI